MSESQIFIPWPVWAKHDAERHGEWEEVYVVLCGYQRKGTGEGLTAHLKSCTGRPRLGNDIERHVGKHHTEPRYFIVKVQSHIIGM